MKSALLLMSLCLGPDDLLKNGRVDDPSEWISSGGGVLTFDQTVGSDEPGSLRIQSAAEQESPGIWTQEVIVEAGRFQRLRLVGATRQSGDSISMIIAMLYDESFGQLDVHRVTARSDDWKTVESVFEVPEECVKIVIGALHRGTGEAWFDDLSLSPTDKPITKQQRPSRSSTPDRIPDVELEPLLRDAAHEIDWSFDWATAKARASQSGRPVLAYVRAVEQDPTNVRNDLRADAIPLFDAQLRKDILFRVGPLSEPVIAEMLNRSFTPLLLTYRFPGQLAFPLGGSPWSTGGGGDFARDAEVGSERPGSLRIERNADSRLQSGFVFCPVPKVVWDSAPDTEWTFRARVKTEGLAEDGKVSLFVNVDSPLELSRDSSEIARDTDWTVIQLTFRRHQLSPRAALSAALNGIGRAWLDDFALVSEHDSENQLEDSGLDSGLGLVGHDAVSPALVLLDENGEVLRRIDRIGVLSVEFIDEWIRECLEGRKPSQTASLDEIYRAGFLKSFIQRTASSSDPELLGLRVTALRRLGQIEAASTALATMDSVTATMENAYLTMREGRWSDAADHWVNVEEADPGSKEAARFWRAWCLHRQGLRAEAASIWRSIAGPTLYGRRAISCSLLKGPRLWLAMSVREVELSRPSKRSTEGHGQGFSASQSMRLLLEWQHPNGSFGDIDSYERDDITAGPWVAAMTAIAAHALWLWQDHIDPALVDPVADAHERAIRFLATWCDQDHSAIDLFNFPYVLDHLLRVAQTDQAQKLVQTIVETQFADGSWSIYSAERTTSFNTAQSLISLARARSRGIDVATDVLERGATALEAMRQPGDLFPYSPAPLHEWMTTEIGSIARDPLCEHALVLTGRENLDLLAKALERFLAHSSKLRRPTKKYSGAFNPNAHGSYFFFYALVNAWEASAHVDEALGRRVRENVIKTLLEAREFDGSFMDHFLYGRAYGTAMAMVLMGWAREQGVPKR